MKLTERMRIRRQ